MLVDCLAALSGRVLMPMMPGLDILQHISLALDLLTGNILCLIGYSLYLGRYPSIRHSLSVILPTTILLAISLIISPSPTTIDILYAMVVLLYAGHYIYIATGLRRHDDNLPDNYSNTDNRSTRWFRMYVLVFFFELAFYYVFFMHPSRTAIGDLIYQATTIIIYFTLASKIFSHMPAQAMDTQRPYDLQQAHIQPSAHDKHNDTQATTGRQAEQGVTNNESEVERMKRELTIMMEERQMYRNPDLSAYDLITELNTNATYFSFFMHNVLNTRFYDYVNGYRLKHATRLLTETNEKISNIAYDSGFNSHNTFVSVFKRQYDMPPSLWRTLQPHAGDTPETPKDKQ